MDFSDAIQNPRSAFLDPALQECTVERRPTGVPWARTGAFASVFKLNYPNGTAVALRVFTPIPLQPDKEERLLAVSDYLKSLGSKKPGGIVGYGYQREGIRIKRNAYPIQTMEWVKGVTLGAWYQARMKAKDYTAVTTMAAHWQKLVLSLRANQIAHGDLQHGNVMVREDNVPVLVDYDGMCVPSLVSDPPKPCFEFGLKGYVHPLRDTEPLGPHLDHFPAWIILIALRASIADPTLFRRYVDEPENENLLFTSADIANHGDSKLWNELERNPDGDVRNWVKDLRASLDRPFAQIPPFQVDPFATLQELCNQPLADWEAIATEADRITSGGKTVPAATAAKVATAKKKLASRTALRAALETARTTGDPRPVAASFDPSIYADWAKHEGLVKQAQRAISRGKLLTELEAAAKSSPDGRKLVATWDRTKAELAEVSLAQSYGAQAESWRPRIAAADAFLATIAVANQPEATIAAAWNRVVAAGTFHPSLTKVHQERGQQASQRVSLLEKLARIPMSPPSEADDQRLVALWDEKLLKGCTEAASYPTRVLKAQSNLANLKKVEDAVRKADQGIGLQSAIVAAAKPLPDNYVFDLRNRIVMAREGEAQFTGLVNILNDPKSSDVAIAAEWEAFQKKHPKHVALLDKSRRDRCDLSVKRRKIIQEIERSVKETADAFEQDKRIAAVWKPGKALMEGSADMERIGKRIQLALVRLKCWETLDQVIRTQDVSKIRAAVAPPALSKFASYPPVAASRIVIEDLVQLAEWLDDLQQKLNGAGGDGGLTLTATDLDKLRRHGAKLEPAMREAVVNLLKKRLWPAIRLTPSSVPPQVMAGPLPMVKLKWTWKGPDLVSWFEVATAPGPLTDPSKAARERISKCRPADHAREGGGKSVVLGGGSSVTATIWPVLDLGWVTLYGPPVHIGPIRAGR